MTTTSAAALISSARNEASKTAVGPFTPIVFERYSFIGGERGWLMGFSTVTADGRSGVHWSRKPDRMSAEA